MNPYLLAYLVLSAVVSTVMMCLWADSIDRAIRTTQFDGPGQKAVVSVLSVALLWVWLFIAWPISLLKRIAP